MNFIPNGISNDWEISEFEVKEKELSEMISIFKTGRGVPPGKYKKLTRNKTVIMSNTPDEINDFSYFVHIAKGSVLINGLGLGCVVKCLLEKAEVNEILVIEKSKDVLKLVLPYFNDKRLNVINEDAFIFKPERGKKFDFVWHDIWDNICLDNLPEITTLHRKYGKRTSWQDSWSRAECLYEKRKEKKYSFYY